MLTAVLTGFLLALPAPWLLRSRPVAAGWLLALAPLALTVYFATCLGAIATGGAIVESHPWVPSLGVGLTFYADGLALLFALLIAGVGALILIYSGAYMAHEARAGHFFRLLLFFMASMLGLVLAGNLITLFVFWELTSIGSFFLIGFHHRDPSARAAARQALLVTAIGEQALLAGILLLGQIAGSLEIIDLLGRGQAVRENALYLPILFLVLAGAFAKSAQVPLHFWLPSAMAAPTPVSAYLHSVTMVKAGVYLLARLSPILGGSAAWQLLLTAVGGTTMLVGAVMALGQTDFKRLLAYSTVNGLGTLVFLLGVHTDLAIKAALVFLLVHALYKGALFLVAGIVDHATGTRDLHQLRGIFRQVPLAATAAVLAALSLAGIPPLFGFVGKETIYHAVLNAPFAKLAATVAAVTANALLVVLAGIVILKPFFGRPRAEERHIESPSLSLGPLLLAGAGLLFGLFPAVIDRHLLVPATTAILGEATGFKLELWHGVNPRLLLSLFTLALGIALYAGRSRLHAVAAPLGRLAAWGPERWYEVLLAGLGRLAGRMSRLLQNGRLQTYLLIVLVGTFTLVAYALGRQGAFPLPERRLPLAADDVAIAVLVLASAVLAIRAPSRLEAIVAMGGVGFGIALLYARFSAPDLGMTQFAVETVTVILFVLVLHRFPVYRGPPAVWSRLRDALVALGAGTIVTLLVAAALGAGGRSRLAPFFAAKTQPEAHGRNMVNVILIDFRGFDTVGEVTVLALAAVGVFALLRPHAGRRPEVGSIIVGTATRYLVPLLLVFSGYLLLRGHVLPGGGFVAGLLFAAAYAFYGFTAGAATVRRELPSTPLLFVGAGLLVILASGVAGMLQGKPFLTGLWSDAAIPAPWEVKLGTPFLFDVGVCLAVAGAALSILLTLWEAE